jgi:hypothetical protein
MDAGPILARAFINAHHRPLWPRQATGHDPAVISVLNRRPIVSLEIL